MAANDQGRSNYALSMDIDGFMQNAQKAKNGILGIGETAKKEGDKMDAAFRKAAISMGAFFTIQKAAEFARAIVRVRGEFQQLEIAFNTMLGSKKKADALMSDIVKFAAVTPFDLQGVASGAKQLLAYGSAAETVIDELEMLGDVSSGLSVPLNEMIYLYGTLRSQGRAYTIDIRQFAGRGVPIYKELAKILNVNVSEVNSLVEAGKVGFPEVEKAFQNMTSEGGMFFNLMKEQNKSVTGRISNLQDSISVMMDEIGEKTQGFITDAISSAAFLVGHYQEIGRVLGVLVATYGSYKAALMAVVAYQKASIAASSIKLWLQLASGIRAARNAQLAFNAASMANPIGLLAGAIGGIIALLTTFSRKQKEAKEATEEAIRPLREEYVRTNDLVLRLKDANISEERRKEILEELREINPEIVSGIKEESSALDELAERIDGYNKMQQSQIALKRFSLDIGFDEAVQDMEEAKKNLDTESAGLINVYTTLFERFKREEDAGQEMTEKFRNAINSIFEADMPIEEKVKDLFDILKSIYENSRNTQIADLSVTKAMFEGISIREYKKSLSEFNDAEEEYLQKRQEIEKRIKQTALAIYPDEDERDRFIEKMNSIFLGIEPEQAEVQDIEKNISAVEQLKSALEELKTVQEKIEQIRAGQILLANPDEEIKALEEQAKKYEDTIARLSGEKKEKGRVGSKEKDYTEDILGLQTDINKFIGNEKSAIQEGELSVYEARISAMESGSKLYSNQFRKNENMGISEKIGFIKKNAEIERQQNEIARSQKLSDLESEYEELRKKIEEEQKKTWLQENKGKTEQDWIKLDKNVSLPESRQKNFEERKKQINTVYDLKNQDIELKMANDTYTELLQRYVEYGDALLQKTREIQEGKRNIELQYGKNSEESDAYDTYAQEAMDEISSFIGLQDEEFSGYISQVVQMGLQEVISQLDMAKQALRNEMDSGANAEKVAKLNAQISVLQTQLQSQTNKKADNLKHLESALGSVENMINTTISRFDGLSEGTKAVLAGVGEVAGAARGMISTISNVVGSAATGMSATAGAAIASMSAMEKASFILTMISLAYQAITAIINAVSGAKAAKKEKEIQSIQARVDELEKSYESLEKAIDKAYSANKKNLILQQQENLERQKALIAEQKRLEEEKGKKTDESKIQGYQDKIEEIDEEIDGIGDHIIEAMTGSDVSQAIDDFAEAYMDAWDAGEDKAKAVKDVVKKMVKSAILELVKSKISEQVAKFQQALAEAMADGILTSTEEEILDRLAEDAHNAAAGIDEGFGKYMGDDEERNAAEKGIATASQDSVDELNGRFTAIQSHTYQMNENVKILVSSASQQLSALQQIEQNTRSLRQIGDEISRVREGITDMSSRGVIIKSV